MKDVAKLVTSSVPLEVADSRNMKENKIESGFEILNEEHGEAVMTLEKKEACPQKSSYIEEDIVHDIKTCLDRNENEINNILITRVVENVSPLRKDVPHLNSTENIISEYDAAMTYKTESYGVSKSDLNLDLKSNDVTQKISFQNEFELSRDDSDVHLKSESKTNVEKDIRQRMNKSEGNLVDAVKKEGFNRQRQSSLISSLTSTSFQWNFSYSSLYALSEKENQAILERKIRMRKRRRQLERRKREEKEQRVRENAIAIENWKQQKRAESASSSKKAVTGPLASGKSKRYKYWYPY